MSWRGPLDANIDALACVVHAVGLGTVRDVGPVDEVPLARAEVLVVSGVDGVAFELGRAKLGLVSLGVPSQEVGNQRSLSLEPLEEVILLQHLWSSYEVVDDKEVTRSEALSEDVIVLSLGFNRAHMHQET